MEEVSRGKTLLVIAHRLPSVQDADKICVMEHGRLTAAGTHEQLLKDCRNIRSCGRHLLQA